MAYEQEKDSHRENHHPHQQSRHKDERAALLGRGRRRDTDGEDKRL